MTLLLVATTGGHLAQLHDIADRLGRPDEPRVWVTHENAQSTSLLAGETVEFVRYVGVKDARGVAAMLPEVRRISRTYACTTAVSTGSGIALGFLPYLAAHGVQSHYVESAARVLGPSITGKILRRCPRVHVYAQYQERCVDGWSYAGSVFDGFEAVPCAPTPITNVVVTLGTAAEFPFRRAVERLAALLRRGGELETLTGQRVNVLWQTGGTPVEDLGIEARDWLPSSELADAMTLADVVIGHAGVGSALAALKAGRPPVLIPREVSFGEVGDGHQIQVARLLEERHLATSCRVEELTAAALLAVAGRRVRRVESPQPFAFVGQTKNRLKVGRSGLAVSGVEK
jgi:UDP-N-acetylglucosamine--N-acetylmuramyl-(pentapeptide) pyrophosphoryl-undecaprenol N-acetylglucosamine transferase